MSYGSVPRRGIRVIRNVALFIQSGALRDIKFYSYCCKFNLVIIYKVSVIAFFIYNKVLTVLFVLSSRTLTSNALWFLRLYLSTILPNIVPFVIIPSSCLHSIELITNLAYVKHKVQYLAIIILPSPTLIQSNGFVFNEKWDIKDHHLQLMDYMIVSLPSTLYYTKFALANDL